MHLALIYNTYFNLINLEKVLKLVIPFTGGFVGETKTKLRIGGGNGGIYIEGVSPS